MLAAVRDLDKPLGKWEREFIFNCSCGVYETAGIAARREQKERERAWRGTKSARDVKTEQSKLEVVEAWIREVEPQGRIDRAKRHALYLEEAAQHRKRQRKLKL